MTRVILLQKANCIDNTLFKQGAILNCPSSWISWGHFDAIYSYALETADTLQRIEKESLQISKYNNSVSYFHPLFLLTSDDESDKKFWDMNAMYLSVSRIHFVSKTRVSEFRACLEHHLDSAYYLAYKTVELSDLVLVSQSNNIADLLKFTLSLRKYTCVGKVYTYCGLNINIIYHPETYPVLDQDIPFLSMRFSIADFSRASKILKNVQQIISGEKYSLEKGGDNKFYITGLNDVVMSWQSIPLCNLIKLYGNWFSSHSDTDTEIPGDTFSEVSTRIGVAESEIENALGFDGREDKYSYKKDRCLVDVCEWLNSLANRIQRMYNHKFSDKDGTMNVRLVRSLSELTSALSRLSHTTVMDQFAFLIFPAVSSFLRNLFLLVKTGTGISNPNRYENYCQFIEKWNRFMENIMRTEGQLTHYSELRPMLYDVPVAMLEYTLAFLECCSRALQVADKEKREIQFLITPEQCRRIVARELFPAKKDHPGLVTVSIPLSMLYNPSEVLGELSHEVSHFVGELSRHRHERVDMYASSVAGFIAKYLFDSLHPTLISAIESQLKNRFHEQSVEHIAAMEKVVTTWCDELVDEKKQDGMTKGEIRFATLVHKVLSNSKNENKTLRVNYQEVKLRYREYASILKSVGWLYKEIYADICMRCLLDIRGENYFLYIGVELSRPGKNGNELPSAVFAIRYYICQSVIEGSSHVCDVKGSHNTGVTAEFAKELYKVEQICTQPDKEIKSFFPSEVIIPIKDYAKQCCETLRKTLDNNDIAKEIPSMYSSMEFYPENYTKTEHLISQYREDILENMSKTFQKWNETFL